MSVKPKRPGRELERRRKAVENTATFGLLLICVALVAPFCIGGNLELLKICKWIYSGGALVYVVARVVNVSGSSETLRVRRLRRMEFWAGVAFMFGAAMWFYQERHLGEYAGMLAVIKNTIMFTLAGALIQIIASWLIVARMKKEQSGR